MGLLAELEAALPGARFGSALEAAEHFALFGDGPAPAAPQDAGLAAALDRAFGTRFGRLSALLAHLALLDGLEGLLLLRDRLAAVGAPPARAAELTDAYAGLLRQAQAGPRPSLCAQLDKQLATVLGASCLRQGIRECLANGEEVDVRYAALDPRFGRALYQGCLDEIQGFLYDEMDRAGLRLATRAALRVV